MATVKASPWMGEMRGKLGDVVFVPQPGGVVQMRVRSIPKNPRSSAQTAWRSAMRQAGRAYQELNSKEHEAWVAYGKEHAPDLRVVNLFIQLSARFLLISPEGTIPMMPPGKPFFGDNIIVMASESASGVTFSADKPTQADMVTELLVQKVSSPHNRTYKEKFRSKGFSDLRRSVTTDLAPGWYACAIRYARPSTGQSGEIIEISRVRVPNQ